MSIVSSLLSALGRSSAAPRAAIPYSAAAAALAAATASSTAVVGFVRPIWFISVGGFFVSDAGSASRRTSLTMSNDQRDNICHGVERDFGFFFFFFFFILTSKFFFHFFFPAKMDSSTSKKKNINKTQKIKKGYGLAMLAQTAVAYRILSSSSSSSPLALVQQLGLAASALHGLWMFGFLIARDTLLETYR